MNSTDERQAIVYIPLNQIRVSPDNPNSHSDQKIRTLANNIQRFGLLNPITVAEQESELYKIVAGEGRFLAYMDLDKRDSSGRWGTIPSIILKDSDEFLTWGRRLSENRLRSFNWIAECISLAGMKADGVSKAELGELFGLSEKRIERMIELGKIPRIQDLVHRVGAARGPHLSESDNEATISLRAATDYILPLRIQVDRKGNTPIWDYSEVDECIKKLLSGEIKPDELPLYSADRREAIGKAKAQTEVESQTSEPAVNSRIRAESKISILSNQIETLVAKNNALEADRESLKQDLTGLNKKLYEVNAGGSEGKSIRDEVNRLVEERLELEQEKMRKQAKTDAEDELRRHWKDLQDEKRFFEKCQQSVNEKEHELRDWEKLIDHDKRSLDREARQRILDAIDGLVDALASLRKNWESLSKPDFENCIEHMNETQRMFRMLLPK
jgi:hypothetical protein